MEASSLSRISFRFFSRIFSPFPFSFFSFLASNTLDFGGQKKAGTGENAGKGQKGSGSILTSSLQVRYWRLRRRRRHRGGRRADGPLVESPVAELVRTARGVEGSVGGGGDAGGGVGSATEGGVGGGGGGGGGGVSSRVAHDRGN